jgi:hypothetical protein
MATIAETLPSPLPIMIPGPRSCVKPSEIQRATLRGK